MAEHANTFKQQASRGFQGEYQDIDADVLDTRYAILWLLDIKPGDEFRKACVEAPLDDRLLYGMYGTEQHVSQIQKYIRSLKPLDATMA